MAEKNNLLVKLDNGGVYKSSKWLVRGVSLELYKGQIVTLIGPNGSGKTTTAKMILNILKSDEGKMESYTSKMAYVPQKISIDWTMPLRVVDFMKLISHDMHFVMSATDHVICLNGHICCSGTPSAVIKDSAYIELFGEHTAATLSLYKHHHDHSHDTDGSIAK
jgi:ABC-type Mn2+/Zn2+ transport system ATPase subunit